MFIELKSINSHTYSIELEHILKYLFLLCYRTQSDIIIYNLWEVQDIYHVIS